MSKEIIDKNSFKKFDSKGYFTFAKNHFYKVCISLGKETEMFRVIYLIYFNKPLKTFQKFEEHCYCCKLNLLMSNFQHMEKHAIMF